MMTIEVIDGVLHQWDVGRKIKIVNPDEEVSEIHFSLLNEDVALVVKPKKDENGVITAEIPNIHLQSALGIIVYVVSCSEEDERTIGYRHLHVNERAKPADYVYIETDVKTYEALENRIKTLEEKVKLLEEVVNGGVVAPTIAILDSAILDSVVLA